MSEKKPLVAATNLSRRAVLDARPQKDKRAQDKLHKWTSSNRGDTRLLLRYEWIIETRVFSAEAVMGKGYHMQPRESRCADLRRFSWH